MERYLDHSFKIDRIAVLCAERNHSEVASIAEFEYRWFDWRTDFQEQNFLLRKLRKPAVHHRTLWLGNGTFRCMDTESAERPGDLQRAAERTLCEPYRAERILATGLDRWPAGDDQ